MKKTILAALIPGMFLISAHADPLLDQYNAPWTPSSAFAATGIKWDPDANKKVIFDDLGGSQQANAVSFNTQAQQTFFQNNFNGVLRGWAQTWTAQGLTGQAFLTAVTSQLDTLYKGVRPALASAYPGLSDAAYKGLMLQNLAHAYYIYGTSRYFEKLVETGGLLLTNQLTLSDELRAMLSLTVGDCSEYRELMRVLGVAWGLPIVPAGVSLNYTSPHANAVFASVHAFTLLVDSTSGSPNVVLLDALTNAALGIGPMQYLGIGTGDGIVALTSNAYNRLATLFASRRVYGFYNLFMQPDYREAQLKTTLPDASLLAFGYNYFLEAYPKPSNSNTGWAVYNGSNSYWASQPRY
ncbi:hypothetical protein [Acidovorax sacchari]|uniref:hypothetical protein n=1 Tax=Acidovorax sacchari TaxID=3230736 RepID=UPI0039E59B30